MDSTAYQTCPLCEAACGLEVALRDGVPVRIRGDASDPLSKGFLCPKGASLIALHDDPERLRLPLIRRGSEFEEVSWPEALAFTAELIERFLGTHDRSALATYVGNPAAHNLGLLLYTPQMVRAAGTRNRFSSGSVDTLPKQFASAQLFGHSFTMPVPDVDRTQYLLILGANPVVSNGSVLTAPNMPERLRAIRERGGKIVVVDPRRTKTAAAADEHVFIRPGTDVWLLAAMANVLLSEGLVSLGAAENHVVGLDALGHALTGFSPELAAQRTGVSASTVVRLARELAAAAAGVVYGRIGTCLQEDGTLASWLIDVLNVLTGNLDRPGGAVFTMPVTERPRTKETLRSQQNDHGRFHSRVDGLPEVFGELPSAALANDILQPGEGQIRGLISVAGNPALSVPDSNRMQQALAVLDMFIAVDCYVNETTRHADVILPGESPLERPHFPFISRWALLRYARWTPGTVPPDASRPREWELMLVLGALLEGQSLPIDVAERDNAMFRSRVAREVADPVSPIAGRDLEEILTAAGPEAGPERLMDFLLRVGREGDGFGASEGGLTLAALADAPHGVDRGPIVPQLPDVLATVSGKIELAPVLLTDRLRALLETEPSEPDAQHPLRLIGRRNLRSNNSWMHNLKPLVRGRVQSSLQINPADAERLGITDGASVRVSSDAGSVEIIAEVTDTMLEGVVCLPHGWGHGQDQTRMTVAATVAGANSNALGSVHLVDALTGTSVSSGIPVAVSPVQRSE